MLEPNRNRLRVKGCPEWVGYGRCTLGISVGQPNHEGGKFAATVEWAARHFEHIRVDVSDTLQRHRLMGAGASPVEAGRASRRAGDDWIMRALPVLSGGGRAYTVVRWDDWLRRRRFAALKTDANVVVAIEARGRVRHLAQSHGVERGKLRAGIKPRRAFAGTLQGNCGQLF